MPTFDNGLRVEAGMTTPSRPGKQPRPVWSVSGLTDQYSQALRDLGGRSWHGAYSFYSDPTEAIGKLGTEDRLSFAERQEAAQEHAAERADRLHEWAGKHAAEADRRSDQAHAIMDTIPFGQPILVGHHSERKHRRDLDRIHNNIGKSVAEREIAADQERRANLNEAKASGEYSRRYIGNRIKETGAELRRFERILARPDREPIAGRESVSSVCHGSERARFTALRDEYADRLAYWEAQLGNTVTPDAPAYSRVNVEPGDEVRIRGTWYTVKKCNPTTVAVDVKVFPWPLKYAWSEVQEHKSEGATTDA